MFLVKCKILKLIQHNKHQQDNNYITVYVVFYVSIGTKLIQGAGKPAPLLNLNFDMCCCHLVFVCLFH